MLSVEAVERKVPGCEADTKAQQLRKRITKAGYEYEIDRCAVTHVTPMTRVTYVTHM